MEKLFVLFCMIVNMTASWAFDATHLDPDHLIPKKLLDVTLEYYETHQESIANKRFIGILDFNQHNSKKRFYIVDMESGRVDQYLSAHGRNSDPDFDGYATEFSNTPDSKMSSLGFYVTAEAYYGSNGYSLRLDGLSPSNSNARERGIVIHPASYVTPGPKIGRSYGCPAVEERVHKELIDQIKDGVLIFASYEKK